MRYPITAAAILMASAMAAHAERVTVHRLPSGSGDSGGGAPSYSAPSEPSAPSAPAASPAPSYSAPSSGGRVHVQRLPESRTYQSESHSWSSPSTSWGGTPDASSSFSGERTRVVRQSNRTWSSSPAHTNVILQDNGVVRRWNGKGRVGVVPNRYNWDHYRGSRYVHYRRGYTDWYGYYDGPRFYWTRYYGDHWWWYDSSYARWAFWSGGYWWWPAPTGVVYVYVNDRYVPYDPTIVETTAPQPVSPPPAAQPPAAPSQDNASAAAEDASVNSPDGKRMVQVTGASGDAFLYDTSSGKPTFMKRLAQNVSQVRFTAGKEGSLARILVDYQDGGFEIFDRNGVSQEKSSAK